MSALIIPNAQIVSCARGDYTFAIPKAFAEAMRVKAEVAYKRNGGYVRLGVDAPKKPRSLLSSRKLHGMIGQLAQILVLSLEETKLLVKDEACALGYPTRVIQIGSRTKVLPQSEALASSLEESLLMDAVLKIGAECGHNLEAEYDYKMRGM